MLCQDNCTEEEEVKKHHGVRELCGSLSAAFLRAGWPWPDRPLAGWAMPIGAGHGHVFLPRTARKGPAPR